jgi:hypothetical protein
MLMGYLIELRLFGFHFVMGFFGGGFVSMSDFAGVREVFVARKARRWFGVEMVLTGRFVFGIFVLNI